MIIEQLKHLAVPIDTIKQDTANPMSHSDKNIITVANSLKKYGQRKPVVVNAKTRIIEAGNGTHQAAKLVGMKEIAAVFVDDDEKDARGYSIMDNQSARLADWDLDNLISEINRYEFDKNIEITGFDTKEIEKLLKQYGNIDSSGEEYGRFIKELPDDHILYTALVPAGIRDIIESSIDIVNKHFITAKKTKNMDAANNLKRFIDENIITKKPLTEEELFFLVIMLSQFQFLRKYKSKEGQLYKLELFGTTEQIQELVLFCVKDMETKNKIPKNAFLKTILEALRHAEPISEKK